MKGKLFGVNLQIILLAFATALLSFVLIGIPVLYRLGNVEKACYPHSEAVATPAVMNTPTPTVAVTPTATEAATPRFKGVFIKPSPTVIMTVSPRK